MEDRNQDLVRKMVDGGAQSRGYVRRWTPDGLSTSGTAGGLLCKIRRMLVSEQDCSYYIGNQPSVWFSMLSAIAKDLARSEILLGDFSESA